MRSCDAHANLASVCPEARHLLTHETVQELACQPWRAHIHSRLTKLATRGHNLYSHIRFNAWMPPPLHGCVFNLTQFGTGDGAKLLCGIEAEARGTATVLSLGSNGDVSFEASILAGSGANVDVFDCTYPRCPGPRMSGPKGTRNWPAELRTGRLRYHEICVGPRDDLAFNAVLRSTNRSTPKAFLSYPTIASHLASSGRGRVTAVKMDIEGFEWPVFDGLLAAHARDAYAPLPSQIAFELHYRSTSSKTLGWTKDGPSAADIARLAIRLYDTGYRTLSKVYTNNCPHCTEISLLRVFCPGTNGHKGSQGSRMGALPHPTVAVGELARGAPWGPADPAKGCTRTARFGWLDRRVRRWLHG